MMDSANGWNGHDPTLSNSGDDFQQFLDMDIHNLGGGINFDFQDFANQHNGQMITHDNGDAMDTSLDGDMGNLQGKDSMMQGQMPPMTTAAEMNVLATASLGLGSSTNSTVADLDAQIQYLQQQRQQQQERQNQEHQRQQQYFGNNRMVPPTPNSMELHSANTQFYPQSDPQQQAMFERYQMRLKEQELAFTPLVSPAVTPLESHFNIGDFTVPGAYFSPLSSPALHAQNEHRSAYETRLNDQSITTSPIDLNIDLNAQPPSTGPSAKKGGKKAASKPKARSVRQSPIVKPQRRKGPSSTTISPQTLSDIIEPAIQQQQLKAKGPASLLSSKSNASGASTTEGSENESVSPEQLSDMAPPPLPRSAKNSPYLTSQNGQSRVQQLSQGMSPATPASLMRLSKGSNSSSPSLGTEANTHEDQIMDNFALPEPANPQRPSISRIDTQGSGQTTPTLDSARTPGFVLPSPAFTRPGSAKSSPQILPQSNSKSSSASVPNTPALRKTPQLAVRGSTSSASSTGPTSKKRASISSTSIAASPALRPRISPSIKPLIRGSSISAGSNGQHISDDTASLLLASKSNYQNILEGTHLPGVSYPTELSTNLTSKRTSHKIAEQGRRNRINSALQEIATLLPKKESENGKEGSPKEGKDTADGGDEDAKDAVNGKGEAGEKGGKGNANGQSANSKASTVEHAIEYIKQLQREVEEERKAREAAMKRAEELERQLGLKEETA